jgi:hypothetical protein
MDHPPFDIAAAIERVHEIVEQSRLSGTAYFSDRRTNTAIDV